MKAKKILFVFRKPNKGNYSIEKVYHLIFKSLQNRNEPHFSFNKITLRYTYDFVAFISYFIKSLVIKKHIVHITGGCHYMTLAFPFKQRILTIHDVYHFKKFKGIKGVLYDLFYFYLPIYFSHKIVVVSKYTKEQLLKFISIPKDKIEVINNPLVIPEGKIKRRERSFSKENPIKILQIGDKPLKNYKRLIEATLELNVQYNFVHSKPYHILKLIDIYKINDRAKVFSNLSEDELYLQYQENDVLYFASEEEGFGLPIIEAQAFGMPVITSNIPPMNDFLEGSILVDPLNIDAIMKGFDTLYNTSVIENKVNISNNNDKKYTINNVVDLYIELYKKM